MSEALGTRLRQERERRQIPLSTIAARTKISEALFEGLERDDLSRWPSGIFRRSFIRAYAEAVGLDAEPIVREILARFPDHAEPTAMDPGTWSNLPSPPPTVLRLTLDDTSPPFSAAGLLRKLRPRLTAVAWDTGCLVAFGLSYFVMFGQFWVPLGTASLLYYAVGILIFSSTPGAYLFVSEAGVRADRRRFVSPAVEIPTSRAPRLSS